MNAAITLLPGTDRGFGLTHPYGEQVWLPRLGPTSFLLWRHCTIAMHQHPAGVDVDPTSVAASLGVRLAALDKSWKRLERFGIVHPTTTLDGHHTIIVRRALPPMPAPLLADLPAGIRRAHHHHLHQAQLPRTA